MQSDLKPKIVSKGGSSNYLFDLVINNCNALINYEFHNNIQVGIVANRIKAIQEHTSSAGVQKINLKGKTTIDAKGLLLLPGFVDLQLNGNKGKLFHDCIDAKEVISLLMPFMHRGTTSVMITLISPNLSQIRNVINILNSLREEPFGSMVIGLHLEGPLISDQKPGIHHKPNFKSNLPASIIKELSKLTSHFFVMITLAPEVVTTKYIDMLIQSNINVAVGHTSASYETVKKAIEHKAGFGTHLFNAMDPLSARIPGALGAFLIDDTTYVSFIADKAHLHKASVDLIRKAKPIEKLVLVSDALAYGRGNLKPVKIGDRIAFYKNNRYVSAQQDEKENRNLKLQLAGSSISLLEAVKNCVNEYGFRREEAINMATLNPASYLALNSKKSDRPLVGQIQEENIANLILTDPQFDIKQVIFEGKLIPY